MKGTMKELNQDGTPTGATVEYEAAALPPVRVEAIVRRAFICIHCGGVYADDPVTQCDCLAGTGKDFYTGQIIYTPNNMVSRDGA